MALRAFQLKDDWAGTREGTETPVYVGNNIPLPEGGYFDTREALGDGDLLVLDENTHGSVIEAVGSLESFKEVSVPDDHPSVAGYDHLSKAQLVEVATQQGVPDAGSLKKDELLAIVKGEQSNTETTGADAGAPEGETPPEGADAASGETQSSDEVSEPGSGDTAEEAQH